MAEEFYNRQDDNKERALDVPREYPLATSTYYSYPEEEKHLRDYIQVLLRRKWILLTFFVAVVTTVTIGTYMIRPQFKSTVTLKIDNEKTYLPRHGGEFYLQSNYVSEEYMQTQYRVLRSRSLAQRAIRKMKLDTHPEFSMFYAASHFDKPGSNSLLDQKKLLKASIINPSIVSSFIGRIHVSPQKNTRLVNVSFVSYDPELAAKAANTLAQSYIEFNIESKYGATQISRQWLEKQLEIMKAKVERAEERLNEYAAREGLLFLEYKVDEEGAESTENIIAMRLGDISKEMTAAISDRISKEALYNELSSGDISSSSVVMNNVLIQSLIKDLAAFESEYYEQLKIYKPEYPKMLAMKEHIDQLKKKINEETQKIIGGVEKDYKTALNRENYLKEAYERKKVDALQLNNRKIQYQILKRDAHTNRELYNGLLQKLKETGIAANITESNIHILDKAEVPSSPFKPNTRRNIMLSLIVGLFGGIGLAFFADYLDNTIKTPEDVEKKIYMPSLGLVPLYTGSEKNLPVEFITHSDTKNPLAEAYTSIRTFLLFSTAGKPPKVMMITSPRREEGKTTTTINTGISLTKSHGKVVLIDADMRKPRLHKTFRISNKTGLSSFLSGNTEFTQDLMKQTDIPGLDVLPAGPLPPNPAELLSSYRLRDLIDGLYPLYNYIIFDTPPILGLADAAITSTITDGITLVVRSGSTPKEAAQQAKKILESVNAKVLGVVLNAINEANLKYGYYSYYQYYYQNYGAHEKK